MYSCIDLYAVEEQMRLETCLAWLASWNRYMWVSTSRRNPVAQVKYSTALRVHKQKKNTRCTRRSPESPSRTARFVWSTPFWMWWIQWHLASEAVSQNLFRWCTSPLRARCLWRRGKPMIPLMKRLMSMVSPLWPRSPLWTTLRRSQRFRVSLWNCWRNRWTPIFPHLPCIIQNLRSLSCANLPPLSSLKKLPPLLQIHCFHCFLLSLIRKWESSIYAMSPPMTLSVMEYHQLHHQLHRSCPSQCRSCLPLISSCTAHLHLLHLLHLLHVFPVECLRCLQCPCRWRGPCLRSLCLSCNHHAFTTTRQTIHVLQPLHGHRSHLPPLVLLVPFQDPCRWRVPPERKSSVGRWMLESWSHKTNKFSHRSSTWTARRVQSHPSG